MNFYEYHTPENLTADSIFEAAGELIANGFFVCPLEKGTKMPSIKKDGFVHSLRMKPINDKNLAFFFKDRKVELGLMLYGMMEVIDVDEKHKAGLTHNFLQALEFGWPELFEKLVISRSPSGGCHILYRSEIVGGKAALAKRLATPNPEVLIERLNESNKFYLKIAPSEGYQFIKGNPYTLADISAEERNWLGAVAASFNEVIVPEVKKSEAQREDSPWNVFNKLKDWTYILEELQERNWKVTSESTEKIMVKRPGNTPQRSSGAIFKDKNTLYLFTTSSEFEDGKAYTPFGVYCKLYHDNNVSEASRALAKEGIGVNSSDEGQFWRRNGKKIEVKYTELLNWLHAIGYRTYNGAIVQVIDNVVNLVDESALKLALLNELEDFIRDQFYEKVATIFSDKGGLVASLNKLEDKFVWDTKDITWLFFKNYAVRITADKVLPIQYKELTGYIWKADIIDRNYYNAPFESCVAERFINILAASKADQLKKLIGYMLSRYKDALNTKAVIIMEDISPDEEGESQGGSGKGLLFQFVKHFRKSADLNGKSINFADAFLFQNVEPDTCIIFIDDVEQRFPFHKLYSTLTGPLHINRKNKPQLVVPFNRSPKIVMTSNYSVGALDNSSFRRKYEFPIQKYFDALHTPYDEFKHEFFTEWDEAEWCKFDNYMINCAVMYLSEPNKVNINNVNENSIERTLISCTSRDFVEYMDGQRDSDFFDFCPEIFKNKRVDLPGGGIMTNAVNLEQAMKLSTNPDHYFLMTKEKLLEKIKALTGFSKLTTTKLTQWLKLWCDVRNVRNDLSFKRRDESVRYYRIIVGTEVGTEEKKWESGNTVPGFKPVPGFEGF